MMKLNPTDQKVLRLIAAAQARQEPAPTIREMCTAIGRSMGAVTNSIKRLKRQNFVVSASKQGSGRTLLIHPERIAIEKRRGDAVRMYYMIT